MTMTAVIFLTTKGDNKAFICRIITIMEMMSGRTLANEEDNPTRHRSRSVKAHGVLTSGPTCRWREEL